MICSPPACSGEGFPSVRVQALVAASAVVIGGVSKL